MAPPTGTSAVTRASTIAAGDSERTLTVGSLHRRYFLHLPPGLAPGRPVPVVLVFHGFGESGDYARLHYGFDDVADAGGFIALYPNGTGDSPSWNAGGCCGYAVINNVDETAFVRAILSDLETIAQIDGKRIYAAGYSNGAMLSYRLACEMSGTFAAIAPVAGVLLSYTPCQPREPVSVIHVHGLSDTEIPYAGGGLSGFGEEYPPVAQSIATWVQLDGCSGPPQVVKAGVLTHTVFAPCRAGSAVELYTIRGLGHGWPAPTAVPGFSTHVIWDFMASHPKP